jgi:hypothetical protein
MNYQGTKKHTKFLDHPYAEDGAFFSAIAAEDAFGLVNDGLFVHDVERSLVAPLDARAAPLADAVVNDEFF